MWRDCVQVGAGAVYIYRCVSSPENRALTRSPRQAPKAPQHEPHWCAVRPQPAAGCCCRPGPQTLR